MGVRLGNGNWAVKTNNLLAYNDASGMFFNKEFDFARATTATRVNKLGLIESVAINLPRIDFLNDTKGHLLLEPASTNKITQSENVTSGGSSPQRIDTTQNVAVAPDGTTTADLCIPNTATGSHQPYQYRDDDTSTSFADGSNYAFSAFVKPNETNGAQFIQMSTFLATGGSDIVNFDIVNGTITQTGFVSSKIENYGNGWFRCSFVFEALRNSTAGGSDGWALGIITAGDSARSESFTGDGSSNGVLVWGSQFEEVKSFATSYIPTSGSSVTRNAEVCNNSGSAQDFNSTEGVLYAEIAALANDLTSRSISLTSGNNADRVTLQYRNASNAINAFYRSSNVNIGQIFFSATDITQFSKLAYRYKENDFALFIDGVEVGSVTSGSFSSTLTALSFDRVNSNDTEFFGKVKEVRAYTTALTDAELIALTT
jgi:hypothetical protein